MSVPKILLWITNILIVGLTVVFAWLIAFQQTLSPLFDTNRERSLEGVGGMTEARELTNQFFDLNYYFIYRDGEVLIDDYMISLNSLRKGFDISKASKEDFLEISTSKGTTYVPNTSDKLFLPIDEDEMRFYFRSANGIHIATWLFFVVQLIWVRRLIKNSIAGDFFKRSSVGVFMKLSYLFIALPFLILLVKGFFNMQLLPEGLSLPDGYSLVNETGSFQFHYLFIGLVLLLIAQAFKQGLKLQEEQALTI